MALLAQGERTLNAKLLDLAWLTLERHRDAIAGAERTDGAGDVAAHALLQRWHTGAALAPAPLPAITAVAS